MPWTDRHSVTTFRPLATESLHVQLMKGYTGFTNEINTTARSDGRFLSDPVQPGMVSFASGDRDE